MQTHYSVTRGEDSHIDFLQNYYRPNWGKKNTGRCFSNMNWIYHMQKSGKSDQKKSLYMYTGHVNKCPQPFIHCTCTCIYTRHLCMSETGKTDTPDVEPKFWAKRCSLWWCWQMKYSQMNEKGLSTQWLQLSWNICFLCTLLMVSTLDCGSSGPGSSPGLDHCVVFLARHLTLTVPLSTQDYKWTRKLLAGQPDMMLGE